MLDKKKNVSVYYEIYRNDNVVMTVYTWLEVLDFIFEDYIRTSGSYEYSFKQFVV